MRIDRAEEFAVFCGSYDQAVFRLAATCEADEEVWLDVLRRYPELKKNVAFNKNVPLSLLEILASDEDDDIREWVAGKRKLSRDLFERLADDRDPGVRSSIAGNPKTPIDVVEKLCRDAEDWVREEALLTLSKRKPVG